MTRILIFRTLLFLFPAYMTNLCACLLGGGTPLDMGINFFDGKRILGDGKTVRGSILGFTCGSIAGFFLGNLYMGILLSMGSIIGDLLGSFTKRRFNFKQGAPVPILDQLNFVIGAIIFVSPIYQTPFDIIIASFFITLPLHFLVNFLGYHLGLKNVPW